jgi:hypothetical protein
VHCAYGFCAEELVCGGGEKRGERVCRGRRGLGDDDGG